MKAAAGLLLLFLPLCCGDYGEETSCDARQNNTKCYGRLGGSVVIQLPNHTSRISRFRWFFNSRVILEMSRGKYVANKLKEGSVISNENITLHNLNWNDAGNYTLELINSEGAITGKWILQLMIQAPVSYVWTTSQCLSQGETKVSCHSLGGDSPFQYSWSLNGVPRDSSENDSSSITLKRGESGFVVCNVNNNVSKASAGQTIYQCAFVDCTLSNGTHISVWLPEGAELTCYGPTTPTTRPTTKPYNNTCNEGALMVRMLFLLAFVLVVAASFVYMHKQMTKYKSLRGRGREIQLEVICAVTVNPEGQQGAAEN